MKQKASLAKFLSAHTQLPTGIRMDNENYLKKKYLVMRKYHTNLAVRRKSGQ